MIPRIDVIANKNFHIVINKKNYREIIVRNSLNGVINKEIAQDINADLTVLQYSRGQEYRLNNISSRTIQKLLDTKTVTEVKTIA